MWFSLHLFKELAEELISLPIWRQEVRAVRPNRRMPFFDNSLRVFNNKKHEIFNNFQGLHLHIGQLCILRQRTPWTMATGMHSHSTPGTLFSLSCHLYAYITNILSSLHEGLMVLTSPTHPHAQSAMCDVGSCTNAASRKGHWITKVALPRIQRDLGGLVIPRGWRNSR
jgi:hypothetical protein